jgi:hypothetical protein
LPSPVQIRSAPDVALRDPAFTALPGATADSGHLGGTVYQIEVPDHWNGRLVLFQHGFGELAPEAAASPPHIRRFLIGHGFAWGASSFSSTSLIPGRAADETAALWDHFATTYGRPTRSYVTGASMGGAATTIAAERYGNRFDGALALCGAANQTAALAITADLFAAGAFAAGVTQADYDASPSVAALVDDRILPALRDPAVHQRFEDLMIEVTGGPRTFDREGFHMEEATNWRRAELQLSARLADNRGTMYPDPAVNGGAIRFTPDQAGRDAFLAGNETTGELQMPLLTMHTTGDGQVPIEQARIYRREVDAAGRSDLIVQRVVRDPGHCGFNDDEWAAGLDALVAWVEHGDKPAGTDVMVDDLRRLDHTYELTPRFGTTDADVGDHALVRGTATLDGQPFDARFLGAVVVGTDGLVTACQVTLPTVDAGQLEIPVLSATGGAGCGAPGARVVLWTFANDRILYSQEAIPWPGDGRTATAALTFSTIAPNGAAPPVTQLSGNVFAADGSAMPGGTRVEAYVGTTRCGVASTRRSGSFTGYILSVVGPTSIAGCTTGAPLRLLVDGQPTLDSAVNDQGAHESFDLTVP